VRIGWSAMISVKELKFKICLIGDWGVGKTSLIRKYVLDQYDDIYISTLGTKTTKKRMTFKKNEKQFINLTLQIWDVMGQKEFYKIQTFAFQGTQAAFIVCDITRKESVESINQWREQLFKITEKIPIIILVNKNDLQNKVELTSKELKTVSQQLHSPILFTSAKTGENVESAFLEIGKTLIS